MHHFPHTVSLTCTLEAENLVSSCFPCIDMCLGAALSARISQAVGGFPDSVRLQSEKTVSSG